jgi:hypothetical protein
MRFQGKVLRQPWATGSKSEHEAVVLMTTEGPLKLRRVGGNPFVDPELERLVGQEITGDGEVHQGQLLMTNWQVISPA